MEEINWKVSKIDAEKIHRIAIVAIEKIPNYPDNLLTLEMDLTACHANGNPLNLDELLDAVHDLPNKRYAMDATHDIFGIRSHIDRNTGKLKDFFVPRFSL